MDQITSVHEQNARNVRFNQHILYQFIMYDDNVILNEITSVITRFESVGLFSQLTSIWERSIHRLLKILYLSVLSHVFMSDINKIKCSVEQSRTASMQSTGTMHFSRLDLGLGYSTVEPCTILLKLSSFKCSR